MKIFDNFKKNITDYTLVNKSELNRIQNTNYSLMKSMQNINPLIPDNDRPSSPLPFLDTPSGSKVPIWRLHPFRVFEMSESIGDLRVVHEAIIREMFRNGLEIKPRFKHKCPDCGKKFKEIPAKDYVPLVGGDSKKITYKCDECDYEGDSKEFLRPDPKYRKILESILERPVNNNEQSLEDMGKMFEKDVDIIDQAAVIVTREYAIRTKKDGNPIDETGAMCEVDMEKSKVSEFIRIHPVQYSMIANDELRLGIGSDDNPRWICPRYEHRDKTLQNPVCDQCGCKAFTAIIETNAIPSGMPITEPKRRLYAKHEVIFVAGRSTPDMLYGNSLVNAIWKKVMSLYHQDEYIWKYFDKDRPPKSILAIGSRNYETVQSFFERQKQGARADPYMPRPVLLNTDNVGQALQYIDLTPNFKELELSELRSELRQIIFSIYGLQPIFGGESSSSGLGNESIQVTISNRTIKYYQRFLNKKFFSKVGDIFGVKDWDILLIDSEEIDKLRELQIKGQATDNAVKMYGMGFDVKTNGNGEFVFSQMPNPERQLMMLSSGHGAGENAGKGNNDKTKKTTASGESKTNFEGEPLMNRPSDVGGSSGGSLTSGSSLSKKGLSETEIRKIAVETIEKGLINEWTLTNMAKKFGEASGIDYDKALNIIKHLIQSRL